MKEVDFIPLGNKVLVKRDGSVNKTASGIIMATEQVSSHGIVMAVSSVIDLDDYPLTPGDRVLLPITNGIPVQSNGEEFELVDITQIYGIMK